MDAKKMVRGAAGVGAGVAGVVGLIAESQRPTPEQPDSRKKPTELVAGWAGRCVTGEVGGASLVQNPVAWENGEPNGSAAVATSWDGRVSVRTAPGQIFRDANGRPLNAEDGTNIEWEGGERHDLHPVDCTPEGTPGPTTSVAATTTAETLPPPVETTPAPTTVAVSAPPSVPGSVLPPITIEVPTGSSTPSTPSTLASGN